MSCRHLPRARWPYLLLAAPLFTAMQPAPAHAEENVASEARETSAVTLSEQRAAEAFQAYSKKEYAAAVALYLEAYEASPNGSILYNIARIYDTKLADRPLAITFYRRYIADPGAYTERIEFANQRLRQLREAELLTSKLDASNTASEAAAPKELNRESREGPEPAREPLKDREGWSSLRWTGFVVGAVGVAALGTGAGFGLAAMSKASTAKDLCDGDACSSQRGVDAANAAGTAATVSNVGLLGGGALLATGAALFLVGANDRSAEKNPGAELRVEPRTTLSSLSLQVTGRW
jgi:hypothetical protein